MKKPSMKIPKSTRKMGNLGPKTKGLVPQGYMGKKLRADLKSVKK